MFLVNLFAYRRIPYARSVRTPISVLIPARNESANIRATLESVLLNRGVPFEVVVLDDHSTDQTAEIVQEIAGRDSRLRLEVAPPLPHGWCGKQHACHVLAGLARCPILLFVDADVRLSAHAISRIAQFMEQHPEVALASGVPRQEVGSFSERLLLPLIHFVLLGFLPIPAMRRTLWPALSAGCGQLFVARRDAYEKCGGHAQLRGSLHDGLKLPRVFRSAGFRTELIDATDLATCRMFQTNTATWQGLIRNAIEAMAAPRTILPFTALLFAGQVLPWLLLPRNLPLIWAAMGCTVVPRILASWRFRQPFWIALLHPAAIVGLLAVQWIAFARYLFGKPALWKGRAYPAAQPVHTA
jgi:hypothetical protein